MADGYPIEAQAANAIDRQAARLKLWPDSKRVMFPNPGEKAPEPGQIFKQPELAATLRKLVEAEKQARAAGKNRKDAIMAAYERFYRGDIARGFAAGVKANGGLITAADLANWKVHIGEPETPTYRGREAYKLATGVQGPVRLQALNIPEGFCLSSSGYHSP